MSTREHDLFASAITGSVTRLDACVQRVVAPNPSALTGPGTNTYVVGSGAQYVVIDPGPDDPVHLERVLAAASSGAISQILCTHSHPDHSPGAARLREMTGAPVYGRPPPDDGHQDDTYRPDHTLEEGDTFALPGVTVRALHTPGHASNHVCFLLDEQSWLCTGDHLMSGSTVVILPPDGSMRAYVESLHRRGHVPLQALLPGHGAVMPDPHDEIRRVIAHRLQREDKVIAAFAQSGGVASLDTLLPVVYADVPERLHGLARYSLLAHVLKLEEEGRVSPVGEAWHWRDV